MKLFAKCLTVAMLTVILIGCGDDTDSITANAPPPAADGRPAGLENDLKSMGDNMLNKGKGAKSAKAAQK